MIDKTTDKFKGLDALVRRFGPEASQALVLEAQQEERRVWKERLAKLEGKGN